MNFTLFLSIQSQIDIYGYILPLYMLSIDYNPFNYFIVIMITDINYTY